MTDNVHTETKKRKRSPTLTRFEMSEYAHKIILFVAISKFVSAMCMAGILYVGFNYIIVNEHSFENEAKLVKIIGQLNIITDDNDKLREQLKSVDEKLRLLQSSLPFEPVEEPKRRAK